MYSKILLPLDGSTLAEQAIPHAVDVARTMDAAIVVLTVIDTSMTALESIAIASDPATGSGLSATVGADARIAQAREDAKRQLDEAKRRLADLGISDVTTEIVDGPAGETIVDRADDLGCDLVVMATHGRSGLKRAVLGSVADYVLRNTPEAAVLVIAPRD